MNEQAGINNMRARSALTLLEMLVALSIIVALSGLVIPVCSGTMVSAAQTATEATLSEARQAVLRYWHDTKWVTLDGVGSFALESDRFNTVWLFKSPVSNDASVQYDPNLRVGWNGPYLTAASMGHVTAPGLADAWNHALVAQYVNPGAEVKDVRLVSAGANGVIDIAAGTPTSSLTSNNVGDDLYVAISLR